MSKLLTPTITISSSEKNKYRYMAVDSYYPFIINDLIWPSVLHYITAKAFEGTLFEEEIRTCKSIDSLKNITKPRFSIENDGDSYIQKVQVYGKGKYRIRHNWRQTYLQYIREAIKEKFNQHPNLVTKLCNTTGMNIIDPTYPENGEYLMELRAEFGLPKKIPSIWSLAPNEKFNRHEELAVIISLIQKMRRMEGCTSYYSEMAEDVMENIQGVNIKEVVKYAKYISNNWSVAPSHIEEKINFFKAEVTKLKDIDEPNIFRIAILLLCLFSLYQTLVYPLKEDLVIPPRSRWYRSLPKNVKSHEDTPTRKKTTITKFYSDW